MYNEGVVSRVFIFFFIFLLIGVVFVGGWVFVFGGMRGVVLMNSESVVQELDDAPSVVQQRYTSDGIPYTIVAEGLTVPWDIVFRPDGGLYVTERDGVLSQIVHDGSRFLIPVDTVHHIGEGGLLGVALHPKFNQNQKIYLYSTQEVEGGTINRVERYTVLGSALTDREIIVDNIPGAKYHDGGRIAFGPDDYLYITTGDATDPDSAQDKNSLAGKILRVTGDGDLPPDNPFGTMVYSFGHRNPQGLAWDEAGVLWSTEHGRSGVLSGLDEINKIERGNNYGWPLLQGDDTKNGFTAPMLHSGGATWAPASAEFVDGILFFGGLRGEALYAYETETGIFNTFLKNEFGRIRTVRYHPQEYALYFTTSNTDGRDTPRRYDDVIIRIPLEGLQL